MKGYFIGTGSVAGYFISTIAINKAVEKKAIRTVFNEPPYKVKGDKLVSVIIPALEEYTYIGYLLNSIEHQTYEPIEIIVADNSDDEGYEKTKDIVMKYKNAKIIRCEPGNISRARNAGAKNSKGEILVFCDADVILCYDYIEKMVNALNKGYVLAHGSNLPFNYNISVPFWAFNHFLFKHKWFTNGASIAVHRFAFDKVKGFPEDMPEWKKEYNLKKYGIEDKGGDVEFGRRIRKAFGYNSAIRLYTAFLVVNMRRERHGVGWTCRGIREHGDEVVILT